MFAGTVIVVIAVLGTIFDEHCFNVMTIKRKKELTGKSSISHLQKKAKEKGEKQHFYFDKLLFLLLL